MEPDEDVHERPDGDIYKQLLPCGDIKTKRRRLLFAGRRRRARCGGNFSAQLGDVQSGKRRRIGYRRLSGIGRGDG